jgi:hypothetical protein
MSTKLTLSLSENVIAKAKKYAKTRGTSISFIVESYLKNLISVTEDENNLSPQVKKLKGIISLPNDYDYKNDLGNIYSK